MPLNVRNFKKHLEQVSKKFTLIGDFPSLLSNNILALPSPNPSDRRQLSTVTGEKDMHAGKHIYNYVFQCFPEQDFVLVLS